MDSSPRVGVAIACAGVARGKPYTPPPHQTTVLDAVTARVNASGPARDIDPKAAAVCWACRDGWPRILVSRPGKPTYALHEFPEPAGGMRCEYLSLVDAEVARGYA